MSRVPNFNNTFDTNVNIENESEFKSASTLANVDLLTGPELDETEQATVVSESPEPEIFGQCNGGLLDRPNDLATDSERQAEIHTPESLETERLILERPPDLGISDAPSNNNQASSSGSDEVKTLRSLIAVAAHMFIAIVTSVSMIFAFRKGFTSLDSTNKHIVLCVIGFNFLMAESIICLAPDNWSASLSLKHKRWVHWILQIVGSILAFTGCVIKYIDKQSHWNSLHGQFGLVAMVFTALSLVNGVTSLYAHELRRFIPGIASKLTHICFGIIALGAASICLIFGFDKHSFRGWATDNLTYGLMTMTGIFTIIIIVNPFITAYYKTSMVIRRYSELT